MKSTYQTILILFTLFLSFNSFAKKGDQVPGYIVFEDGNRVEGTVTIGSIIDNEVKVVFQEDKKSKKTTYRPADLLAYGYEELEKNELGQDVKSWVHYERFKVDYPPKMFATTTVFMEKEVDGAISVYCYYIEVRNDPKQPFRYFYYLKDQNDEIKKVEQDNFLSISKTVFKDYTALTQRIGKESFEYRNLDRMVRDYNYWLSNQHDSNEYRVAMIKK